MEKRVALAQCLRSFLDESISASSTDVTTIEAINHTWQLYCESKNVSCWKPDYGLTEVKGKTPVMRKARLVHLDALERMLTDYYKYESVQSEPYGMPAWKCKIVYE